jgi:hypothetical protein
MNEIKQILPLLRHSDIAQRRKGIQALGAIKTDEALKTLALVVKNEPDADLKALALETGKALKRELSNPAPKPKDEFVVDESLFEGELPPQAFQTSTIPVIDLEAKQRRMIMNERQSTYDVVDKVLMLILLFSIFPFFMIGAWIDLSKLQLEWGGTYGDLIEEQKEFLEEMDNGEADSYNALDQINVEFDVFEMTTLVNNTGSTPYTNIYFFDTAIQDNLISLGYDIPNETLAMKPDGMDIVLYIAVFGIIVVLLLAMGVLVMDMPYVAGLGGIVFGMLAQFLGPKGIYWLIMLVVLTMFVMTWIWLFGYMMPLVDAILANMHIPAYPYAMMDVMGLGVWMYQLLLVLLIGVCLTGLSRRSPIPAPAAAKSASKSKMKR